MVAESQDIAADQPEVAAQPGVTAEGQDTAADQSETMTCSWRV